MRPAHANIRSMGRREARKYLINAIRSQDIDLVTEIATTRAELVDARNSHGHTPLSEAIGTNNLDIVKLLVDAGGDPMQRNHGGSSLIDAAAYNGSAAIAQYLATCGCILSLQHSAALGNLEIVEHETQKDPNAVFSQDRRGATPLHHAAHGNHREVARLLLSRGAKLDALDRHGHSPLAYAVERSSAACGEFLLEQGANPNAPAGYYGGTVLHRAIVRKYCEFVVLLLSYGSDPNRQDHAGKSALHEAISGGKLELVIILLAHGVDLSLRTRKTRLLPGNETPREYASRLKKKRIVALIDRFTDD